MCGITGIVGLFSAMSQIRERLASMVISLKHRGADDDGMLIEHGTGLGHCRLAIIDLTGGKQPLANEDNSLHLVANGEIYNYRQLRQDLIKRGHRFKTRSDCEAIVHLYEDYGPSCVEHLNGMFAFALWDSGRRRLMLARDRFGIKPLYFARTRDALCFASELTAILASGLVPAQIDPVAVYAYLAFGYVPGPLSIIKSVEKVMPAQTVVFEDGQLRRSDYWRPSIGPAPRSLRVAVGRLDRLLDQSVKDHLVADVPVGAFLSGGVDSSTIVAMARRHAAMETFCVGFPGLAIDETAHGRRAACHLGTRHHEIALDVDPATLLQQAVAAMDEPLADSSALPTFAVCRAARRVAKVMLSGDGGDEVFGGYTGRYRVAALKAAVPHPRGFADLLNRLPPWRSGRRSSMPQLLAMAGLPETVRHVNERQITTADQRRLLMGAEFHRRYEPGLQAVAAAVLEACPYDHPVHRALWLDLNTSLPDDMLTKVDRMSMAHGLEVRVPLLDHRLVEFALSLPAHWLVSPLPVEGKRILRRLAATMLPAGHLHRPKQGFVVPLNEWLSVSFMTLLDDLTATRNGLLSDLIDLKAVEKMRRILPNSRARQDLYAILVLALWLQQLKAERLSAWP